MMPALPKTPSSSKIRIGESMAISHELSSEIATALLTARERSPGELDDLKEMLLQIHSTLEGLSEKRRVDEVASELEPSGFTKAVGSAG